jgi:hypothetical protein
MLPKLPSSTLLLLLLQHPHRHIHHLFTLNISLRYASRQQVQRKSLLRVQQARRSISPVKPLAKTVAETAKPVRIQCLLSQSTSFPQRGPKISTWVTNTDREGTQEEDYRRKPQSTDSSPTNATSEHQGSPQLPRQGGKQVPIAQLWQALDAYHNCFGQERKAVCYYKGPKSGILNSTDTIQSQMTEDAAGPAALVSGKILYLDGTKSH